MKLAKELNYASLAWNDKDGKHFLLSLRTQCLPNLVVLNLCHNNLGVDFCRELVRTQIHQHCSSLCALHLGGNPLIGDEGVAILVPLLFLPDFLEEVKLSKVSLSVRGCHALAGCANRRRIIIITQRDREVGTSRRLTCLELGGGDMIGDEGLSILAPSVLASLRTVSLTNMGLTDAGCQILANIADGALPGANTSSRQQVAWERLDLYSNNIKTASALERIIDRVASLKHVTVLFNPVYQDGKAKILEQKLQVRQNKKFNLLNQLPANGRP